VAIRIKRETFEAIKQHGEDAYPNECCGFLIGAVLEGVNVLSELYRAENEWPDEPVPGAEAGKVVSRQNRYLITPEQWRKADSLARGMGHGIIGYYHSHPDHPAVPSGFDLDHSCWPGESYIIVAVAKGKAEAVNSYTKPDYSKFEKEEILIEE
jgi:proteasome lid subunit RPN8/RPN11